MMYAYKAVLIYRKNEKCSCGKGNFRNTTSRIDVLVCTKTQFVAVVWIM